MSRQETRSAETSILMGGGIIAGPLFVGVALIQAFSREGFDWSRHPLSMLSLGDFGWVQITNFVITGLLFIIGAVGISRARISGIGQRWVPRLLTLLGIALIAGGAFTPDPALGFPPGSIAGLPATMSWHASIHAIAPMVGLLGLLGVLGVLARRFADHGRWPWVWLTAAATVAMIVLSMWPNFTADWQKVEVNFVPMWVGVALAYIYVAVVLAKLKGEISSLHS